MVSNLRGRERASAKAKRKIRSTPARVMIVTSVATSARQAAMHAPAGAGIFAFRILAHDHPVELRTADRAQGAHDPRQHPRRAHVGVLVERLADRKPETPEADVVGHVRRTDRAEIDRVRAPDLIEAVRRHHEAGRAIMVRSPVEPVEGPLKAALALSKRLEDLEPGGNNLLADAVAGNDRNSDSAACTGLPRASPRAAERR